MKVNVKELNKKELEKVMSLYIEYKTGFKTCISFEEFANNMVRQCDSCFEYYVVDYGDTLIVDEKYKCEICDDCYYDEYGEHYENYISEMKDNLEGI